RGGRATADYGEDHVAAIRRYTRLHELGFPPAAIKLLLEAREGAPFPVAPGITLIVDPGLLGSGAEAGPLVERIAKLITDPVHATLFALTARIGERTLQAHAKRKVEAREAYEGALERGKTAVLHEEVLRGVHMLSVGHVPPEAEVEIRATWAITLTHVDGRS